MGDHRADVKIEFTFHGETRKLHLDWVNYVDGGDGIDDRVRDFFEVAYTDGMSRFHDLLNKEYRERHAAEIEAEERRELARLQSKYNVKDLTNSTSTPRVSGKEFKSLLKEK